MVKTSIPWRSYLLLICTALFWSGNFVLARGIRELIPPISLNFWRWAGALALLLPFTLPRLYRQRHLLRRHWRWLTLMSIPSVVLFNTFIYAALQSASATNTMLVNAVTPVFIVLLAWLVFRDRLAPRQILGVCLSLAGLLFIITRGEWAVLSQLRYARGDLWTLGAALAWALYSVFLRQRPAEIDPLAFLSAIIALGVLILLPFYLAEAALKGGFAVDGASLASIAYVCVFPSLLAYLFWNRGVERVGPGRAGIFMHLMPVFGIVLAALFLGERLSAYHLGGMVLIFSGIALTTYPVAKPRNSP
jgi:drug/metabolite transporter (DMT)-like permease